MGDKMKSEINKVLSTGFSVLFPVYNEGKIIERNAKKFYYYVKSYGFKNFEILLCDNRSTDDTGIVSKNLSKKYLEIKYVYTGKKGIGAGIKSGIKLSKHDLLIMTSIDLAFDSRFIPDSISSLYAENADVVIGSKRHDKSKVVRPFSRKLASFLYNTLVNMMFFLWIGDTQGAVAFKKSSVMPILKRLSSDDSFFQTQLMIWSKHNKLKIIEIPVKVIDIRKSSFNIKLEAFSLFKKLIKEFYVLHFGKN